MCGIAAIISPGSDARLADLVGMADSVRHRGPDSEGYAVFAGDGVARYRGPDTDNVGLVPGIPYLPDQDLSSQGTVLGWAALGQRRLSILDLSALGHQPMCDPSGRYWIVFNGEIYNYVELRRELQDRGHRFFGHSDTEVLLAAYAEWGSDCLGRLIGMFAFVLVDIDERRLLVARDRFGIKPLYAWQMPSGSWAFASEIKQFTVLPGWAARINGRRAYDFLNYGFTDHASDTMFASVVHVRGGEYIDARIDDLQGPCLPIERWWTLKAEPFEGTFEEAAQEFRRRFEDSIALHLRSDVPVGSCLSGGLDSSSIVCEVSSTIAEAGRGQEQWAFSATSDDPRVDESRWMRIVADATGVRLFSQTPELERIPDLLPKIAWHMDEPFGSTSILAQWSVFQLAAEHGIKVMLDGQGADEQLAGYLPFFAWRYQELLRQARIGELVKEIRATNARHGQASRRLAMVSAYLTLPAWLGRVGGRLVDAPGQRPGAWLDLNRLGIDGHPDPMREFGGRVPSVQALAAAQLTSTNLPALLRYEDRDSMASSVEARVPFLDHRLVEFVQGLPSACLISEGTTKRVLREAMKGVLPEPIRTRVDKIGFQTSEEAWMRANPDVARALTEAAIQRSDGVLKPRALALLQQMLDGGRPFDYAYWRRISYGAWIAAFDARIG